AWRANPLAQPPAPVADTRAKGPEIVADPPKPVVEGDGKAAQPPPVEGAGEKRVEPPPPPAADRSGEKRVEAPPPPAEDGAASGLGALSRAKPVSLVADGRGFGPSEYAAVAPPPERADATVTPQAERGVAAAAPQAPRETVSASELAKGLLDPSPAERTKTA